MKKLNGYWTDQDDNKWNCNIYTEEQAIKWSKTLTNCKNCINCRSCYSCNYCDSCYSCNHCNHCNYCNYCDPCNHCNHCNYCNYCNYCDSCNSCNYCNHCNYCYSCDSCDSCNYWETNPQRYTTTNIGSRDQQTTFYFDTKRVQVVCGCFIGTLSEFENKVKETHGDNKYGKQYQAEIKKLKALKGGE